MIHLDFGNRDICKFIYGQDQNGESHVVVLPKDYHRDIAQAYSTDLNNISGGYIEQTKDGFSIFGSSESFGSAPLEEVEALLAQEHSVKIDSELDRVVKNETTRFQNYVQKFDDPFMTNTLAYVKDHSILGGLDSLKRPLKVADGLATVIYATENGSSFGFDTLWVAKDDVVRPVAVERWDIVGVESTVDENKLHVSYTASNQQQSLDIDLENLAELEPQINLTEAENILRNLYAEQTERVKQMGGVHVLTANFERQKQLIRDGKLDMQAALNSQGHLAPPYHIHYLS